MTLHYDPDIQPSLRPILQELVAKQDFPACSCGSTDLYAAIIGTEILVKCYDCGEPYMELEIKD